MKKILSVIGRSAGIMLLLNFILQLPILGPALGSLRAHDFNDAEVLSAGDSRPAELCQSDCYGDCDCECSDCGDCDSDCECDW